MKKFMIFLFKVFLLAWSSAAQNCNNPLLSVFNIPGLDQPVSGEGLPVCFNLQIGQTCCSNGTVLNFQVMLDRLTGDLQVIAGERDNYIAQLDHNYTSQFQEKLINLTDLVDEISDIQRVNSTLGDQIHTQFLSLRQLGDKLYHLHHNNNFTQDFIDMQNKRATCFTTLLQIQGAAYCLACDPNWESQGVSADGSVTSAPVICTAIQDACTPFTAAMDKFNPLFQARQAYPRLLGLIEYLKFFHENKLIPDVIFSGDIQTSLNATERTNSLPPGCDEDGCIWQCSNLFDRSFAMNLERAGNGGGVIGTEDIAYPDLGTMRHLQGGSPILKGTWNPDLNVSQLVIFVAPDPGDAVAKLDKESSSSDSDIDIEIDPHLGCSRIGLSFASIVIVTNIALSILM